MTTYRRLPLPRPGGRAQNLPVGVAAVQEVWCHDAIREGSVANRQRPTEYNCHMGQINDRCPFCLVCEREVHRLAALPGADTTVIPRPVPV